ncbi:ferritin [bacterium]|nr:ferritin [bacterium]
MLSKKMYEALNAQVNHELESEYVYLQLAAWSKANNLEGFSNWMKHQAEEEREHAMKIHDFLIDNEHEVVLTGIEKPKLNIKSAVDVFRASLKHEQKITKNIHDCYSVALAEKCYKSQVMLQWFIEEQVEEEANAKSVLDKLETLKDSPSSIYWIDKELKKRGKE